MSRHTATEGQDTRQRHLVPELEVSRERAEARRGGFECLEARRRPGELAKSLTCGGRVEQWRPPRRPFGERGLARGGGGGGGGVTRHRRQMVEKNDRDKRPRSTSPAPSHTPTPLNKLSHDSPRLTSHAPRPTPRTSAAAASAAAASAASAPAPAPVPSCSRSAATCVVPRGRVRDVSSLLSHHNSPTHSHSHNPSLRAVRLESASVRERAARETRVLACARTRLGGDAR